MERNMRIMNDQSSTWIAWTVAALVACATQGKQAIAAPPVIHWNVAEMGATADGATDVTGIFQTALHAAGKAGGGIVDVPAGRYCLRGTLSIPQGVTLQGTYRVPPTVSRKDDPKPDGSVLLAYAGRGKGNGPAFIRLAGRNSSIAGLVVIYPEWKQTDVPPVQYPPCVESLDTENVGIADCCFLNPYDAIRLVRAARHLVRNVTGYPSHRGIFVDECYDIGHIENIHFWPFGVAYRDDDPYCLWINTQGVAFELARTDWHYVFNTFCFGYGVGYKFSASERGSTNGNFLGLGADSCRRAVLVEQVQAPGLLITNGEFVGRWGSVDSVGVEVGPQVEGKVSLVNCSFWGPLDRCAWIRSPRGQATFDACHFVQWDNHFRASPAIYLEAGKAIVQGSTFAQEGMNVLVGEGVRSAILTGNQADGGFRFSNPFGRPVESAANEKNPLEVFPGAKLHYRIDVGAAGDGYFLSGWHGQESAGAEAGAAGRRWSTSVSHVELPVATNKPYRIVIHASVPKQAASPEAGVYLGGKRIAAILSGKSTIEAELPATASGHVSLELRCRGWVPKALLPGSKDDRVLGIDVHRIEMRAAEAAGRVFQANTGRWDTTPP
jgi:hypothetical protein